MTTSVGQLLQRLVVTEDGRLLGRVYDFRLHVRGGRPQIVAMAVGATGIRKRLSGNVERAEPPADYVRWEDVVSVDSDRIVVRARS